MVGRASACVSDGWAGTWWFGGCVYMCVWGGGWKGGVRARLHVCVCVCVTVGGAGGARVCVAVGWVRACVYACKVYIHWNSRWKGLSTFKFCHNRIQCCAERYPIPTFTSLFSFAQLFERGTCPDNYLHRMDSTTFLCTASQGLRSTGINMLHVPQSGPPTGRRQNSGQHFILWTDRHDR